MVGVISSPRNTAAATATNNSEDETEWPRVDVRNLIIDLDADIKADRMMTSREKVESCPAPVLPPHSPLRMTNGSSLSNSAYDSADCDKSLKMKIKRTKSGRQEIVKEREGGEEVQSTGSSDSDNSSSPSPSPTPPSSLSPTSPSSPTNNSKRLKVDVGTSTDASTLTEPENLGACEPGTSVNLEGIVWHETDTGVLVVNITWRGKTYVGTLLDCTRHTNQWSAPRFTDSPEPGSKGRAKRNRTSMTPSDLEPRKNLRSSKAKGKGKGGKGEEFNFPAPSSPAKDSGKRKGRPDDSEDGKKRKRTGSESEGDGSGEADSEEQGEESLVTPVPSRREPKPELFSYKMMSCPRRECSKQYKHEEGLRWHLSHSHPEFIDTNGEIRDAATVEREEQERRRKARLVKEEKRKEGKGDPGDKPPTKVAKLDTERPRDGVNSPKPSGVKTPVRPSNGTSPATPVSAAKPPPAQPVQPSPRQPGQLPAGLIAPTLKSAQKPGGGEAEDLQKKTPDQSTVTNSLETEKPANSPAYSDISDDGEDSRGRDLKLPATPVAQPLKTSISSTNLTSFSSLGLEAGPGSGPRSSSVPPHSSPAPPIVSPASRDSRSSSIYSQSSHGVGPSPGTPEYHKYLAANGFPPFPYPYPVGMDPNYHVQLLKTDPIYKAKWEKDRAERERAFKEELDKDQGRYSGLSLLKDDKTQPSTGSSLPSTPVRRPESRNKLPEDLRKREREESGDRSKTAPSPMSTISVKAEFRERDDVKKEVKMEEGVKPTMETRGPPPGPQTFGYMHPSLVRPPYSMPSLPGLPPPFDPILSSSLAPFGLPGGPNPYLSSIRPPPGFTFPGDPLRSPFPSLPGAEELRGLPAPPGLSGTKALDLLQQHASQYYANQKLAELQERALKSPSSSLSSANSMGRAASPAVSKAITTVAGKESPTPTTASSVIGDKSKSPPPLRHVHTHTHTHIGLGYPLLPPVPPPGLPPGALPPPAVGVVPASFTGSYPGKSP